MFPLTGLGNAIAKFNPPDWMQRGFLATSKEGPHALLMPEGSVILGRTISEGQRSGFLGARERITEEVTTAAVWIFGVEWMRRLFNKFIKPKMFKGSEHLTTGIAWEAPWKRAAHVGLTPQQMFARDAAEAGKLLKVKGYSWLFSVGSAVALLAYIVPKFNQYLTDLFLKLLYVPNATQPGSQPAVPPPHAFPQTGSVVTPFPVQQPIPMSYAAMPVLSPQPPLPPPTAFARPQHPDPLAALPSLPPPWALPGAFPQPFAQRPVLFEGDVNVGSVPKTAAGPVKFGFAGGAKILNGLGHSVEQTPYGGILVLDFPLTLGRVLTGNKRSPFEGLEYAFRDAVSLYFYILFAPNVMWLLSKPIDKAFSTVIRLEPKVAEAMNRLVEGQLKAGIERWIDANPGQADAVRAAFKRGTVPLPVLRDILMGATNEALKAPAAALKQAMRSAAYDGQGGFKSLLEKEAAVYLTDAGSDKVKNLLGLVDDHLGRTLSGAAGQKILPGTLSADNILNLLEAIRQEKGLFKGLSRTERLNLEMAVKQAFSNTAGTDAFVLDWQDARTALKSLPVFRDDAVRKALDALPDSEARMLAERIARMARRDSLEQANTMFRRSLNLLRDPAAFSETPAHMLAERAGKIRSLDERIGQRIDVVTDGLKELNWCQEFARWRDEAAGQIGRVVGMERPLAELEKRLAEVGSDEARKLLGQLKPLKDLLALARMETLADWLDKAVNSRVDLGDLLEAELDEVVGTIKKMQLDAPVFEHLINNPRTGLEQSLAAVDSALADVVGGKAGKLREKVRSLRVLAEGHTQQNLDDLARTNLQKALGELVGSVKPVRPDAPESLKQLAELLSHYRQESSELLAGKKARLFSLAVENGDKYNTLLADKINEMTAGGVLNDTTLRRRVLEMVGQFTPDSRNHVNPAKMATMQGRMVEYAAKLLNELEKLAKSEQGVKKLPNAMALLGQFQRRSRNFRYGAWTLALGGTMACLGWLVPKAQYHMTKRLTGKDEHPGIANAAKAYGLSTDALENLPKIGPAKIGQA